MPMELQGFDDLTNDLTNMAAKMEFGPGVARALKAGAVPIEQQMKHNASTNPQIITGALYNSIRTGSVKKRRMGGKHITVGVHRKDSQAYYASPVEFGHGGPAPAPAHPFIRPAYDTRSQESFMIMKGILRDELSR